ncbi:MAG TPA: potassium channel family protein, partial [Bacteroidia bacterium]|nr:potassium channel family protein [Bacteroidia bacterium]
EFFVLTSKNWSSFLILGRCILLFQLISALLIYFSLFIDKTCFKGIGGFWGSWYYTIVTFTTLGYGDAYPHNWWGKLIAGGIALVGYLSLALLIYLFTRKIDKTY